MCRWLSGNAGRLALPMIHCSNPVVNSHLTVEHQSTFLQWWTQNHAWGVDLPRWLSQKCYTETDVEKQKTQHILWRCIRQTEAAPSGSLSFLLLLLCPSRLQSTVLTSSRERRGSVLKIERKIKSALPTVCHKILMDLFFEVAGEVLWSSDKFRNGDTNFNLKI